ncbi:FAD-dependent oxidoreductase [Microbacterium sp. BK668]|uniref:protoporphyrinogen/coproporphyrinogen oxidase n=1 Tax=Microbacterium sp. BK668 TaxID=2512118 RepID=UPI0010617303|nr:FAD-dependent oxidoreductase [Microbacterium sp. BK668]TDN91336.1 oxygen-dependent protoporphyrinogen oxidase [Microbacterium sp. BK668]
MSDSAADRELEELAEAAHERHVVVVGGGIAGLVAALECAKVGLRVTLVEASDRLGGNLRTIQVAGLELDAAVEGWSSRGAAVRALVRELGLEDRIVPARDARTWIAGLPSGAAPLPDGTIAGIPENPWDEDVRRIIGWSGTWRAYVDRLRPPLTIGKERSLGALVRSRMGAAVLDRLVAPLSLGVYGIHPDDIDVEGVAPGLSTALTRTGSLSGAVADLLVDRRKGGGGLEGLVGGTAGLVDALRRRLEGLGAEIVLGRAATRIERRADGRWTVAHAPASGDLPALDPADDVIVALPEHGARRLLAPLVPALDAPAEPSPAVEVVTLVVRTTRIDGSRGAVHPLPGTARAVGVVDSTARWPWLPMLAGEGIRILRVSFGTAGAPPVTGGLDDGDAFRLAADEASALLGVSVGEVSGAARERFAPPTPASALGHADAAAAARAAIRAVPGLAAAGGWLAGSGLAQIVPDSIAEAERVRRRALFGGSAV